MSTAHRPPATHLKQLPRSPVVSKRSPSGIRIGATVASSCTERLGANRCSAKLCQDAKLSASSLLPQSDGGLQVPITVLPELVSVDADVTGLSSSGTNPNVRRDAPASDHAPLIAHFT